ncbi:MAG TPA: type II toxin-antitoxin system RelE/ParE family toxin [Sulfurovum sp.]|nr:type II toxin-antitoxin system RelE/ParE family toxin [Sulfurovum sp.]
MNIIKTIDYQQSLKHILSTISKDKKSAASLFNQAINKKIKHLSDFPFMYRISIYFDNEYIRDMTHKGYTIPYEVDLENNMIYIIGITKYKNSLK